ncbi:MAG TPA: hypothetical protein DDZ31_00740 [Actinobacteria bacterium]|jgi:tellurite resistance protein|nr:hypothetical protein [Actinomycetota bacterium]
MIRNQGATRYPKFIKFCLRIPVGTFGLVLGLVGCTAAWFAYSGLGSSVTLIVSAFFIFSAIVWLFVVFAFVLRAFLAPEDVTAELRNPNSGVFASSRLMAAMLLGAMVYHMNHMNHMAGQLVVFSFSALTLMFGSWLMAIGKLRAGTYLRPAVSDRTSS